MATAGYSGTPLAKKLGFKPAYEVLLVDAPANYRKLVEPLPEGVKFVARLASTTDIVHAFVTRKSDLARSLKGFRAKLNPNGVVWVSWPKKSAGVATDVTEDTVRELALPLGFIDIKVCAVDETWSGLKLMVRKALR